MAGDSCADFSCTGVCLGVLCVFCGGLVCSVDFEVGGVFGVGFEAGVFGVGFEAGVFCVDFAAAVFGLGLDISSVGFGGATLCVGLAGVARRGLMLGDFCISPFWVVATGVETADAFPAA